jgi:hypothetical protein
MKRLLLLCLGIASVEASSQQLFYKPGAGIYDGRIYGRITTFNVGYEDELTPLFRQKVEIGYWNDLLKSRGHKDSFHGAYSIGAKIMPSPSGGIYGESYLGVGLVQRPDVLLGSTFQFSHDIGVGIEDGAGRAIGISLKHYSNAGLVKPNWGRNFIQFSFKIPIGRARE